jgi:hypothetical protein
MSDKFYKKDEWTIRKDTLIGDVFKHLTPMGKDLSEKEKQELVNHIKEKIDE